MGTTLPPIDSLFPDPFEESGEESDSEDDWGSICELTTCEARYNAKGDRVLLHAGKRKVIHPPPDQNSQSALVLTKVYDRRDELEYTEMEVRSPHIKAALHAVAAEHPGVDFKAPKVVVREFQTLLFHYHKELREYGVHLTDRNAAQHLNFALQYLYKTLTQEMRSYMNHLESPHLMPALDFMGLWMVFRPGDFVYRKVNGVDLVFRFKSMSRCSCTLPWCSRSRWLIEMQQIIYNGENFGYNTRYSSIVPYDGYKALTELTVIPLKHHPNKTAIRSAMIERGRKFINLHGLHHREYDGKAEALSPSRRDSLLGEEDEYPLRTTIIRGRIIIDGKKFVASRPCHEPTISYTQKVFQTETGDHLRMQDDELLICDNDVMGFSLVDKLWCLFNVEHVHEFEYNKEAFHSLLLPDDQKQTILSLVTAHETERIGFDDVIKGKGKGMIFLLHGVPGVGKTLTAGAFESVAEFSRRPLYTISAGDLGTAPATLEQTLGESLELAAGWKAIVLLDEADVFLEERSLHDLERNSLVSVFLRVLEYYGGIMILTTNRIGVFDSAFKSRIHLAIKYQALSIEMRRDLWRTFLARAASHNREIEGMLEVNNNLDWMDDTALDRLAQFDLNGRQIKNTVRTSHVLATSRRTKLSLEIVETSIRKFDEDFAEDKETIRNAEPAGPEAGRALKRRRLG